MLIFSQLLRAQSVAKASRSPAWTIPCWIDVPAGIQWQTLQCNAVLRMDSAYNIRKGVPDTHLVLPGACLPGIAPRRTAFEHALAASCLQTHYMQHASARLWVHDMQGQYVCHELQVLSLLQQHACFFASLSVTVSHMARLVKRVPI